MTIALDTKSNFTQTGGTSATFTFSTTVANDVAIFYVFADGNRGPVSASSSGLTIHSLLNAGTGLFLFWALVPSVVTSQAVTLTFTTGLDDLAVVTTCFSGCYAAAPFDPNAASQGTAASTSTTGPVVTISTTNPDDFVVLSCGNGGYGGSYGAPTGFTTLESAQNSGGTYYAYVIAFGLSVSAVLNNVSYQFGNATNGQSLGQGQAWFVLTANGAPAPVYTGAPINQTSRDWWAQYAPKFKVQRTARTTPIYPQPPTVPGIDPGRRSRAWWAFHAEWQPKPISRSAQSTAPLPASAFSGIDPGRRSRGFYVFLQDVRRPPPRRPHSLAAASPPVSAPFVLVTTIG